jgi:hypothetical protein
MQELTVQGAIYRLGPVDRLALSIWSLNLRSTYHLSALLSGAIAPMDSIQ